VTQGLFQKCELCTRLPHAPHAFCLTRGACACQVSCHSCQCSNPCSCASRQSLTAATVRSPSAPQRALARGAPARLLRRADYSKMMEMTDDYGHNIFETIKITLVRATHTHRHAPPAPTPPPLATQVCDDCLKTGAQAHPYPPTRVQTPSSFTYNHLLVSLCSQITPKSAPASFSLEPCCVPALIGWPTGGWPAYYHAGCC